MSFRGTRLNSSLLRRERVLIVEAKAAFSTGISEEKVKEIAEASTPLPIEGGNATLSFQDDQIVLDGGGA